MDEGYHVVVLLQVSDLAHRLLEECEYLLFRHFNPSKEVDQLSSMLELEVALPYLSPE
jgi:hypothetical protein